MASGRRRARQHDYTDPVRASGKPENSTLDWLDWHSNGPWFEVPESDPAVRHSYFGIAITRTERLTVTTIDGDERDVRITPWNGAYVVIAPGPHSVLTGYDADGDTLGTVSSEATPPPESDSVESWPIRLPAPAGQGYGVPILTWEVHDPEDERESS